MEIIQKLYLWKEWDDLFKDFSKTRVYKWAGVFL